ncbi:MAG: sigma-E processing peptidase SpoIIGA [Christensenellaceae bacterium]|jgi:stage II sporulation protein GA (sporulation sigma-E factor processing peptidase)|nr:sigma-E processing peptidase SpoIIGA [Christensenellaceae bacterium]
MRVYVELFLLQNFAMDALVLSLALRLSRRRPIFWRVALAAALGSGYALAAYWPPLRFLQGLLFRTACIVGMCGLALRGLTLRTWLRTSGFSLVALICLGGTGYGLMEMLGARGFGLWQAIFTAVLGAMAMAALSLPLGQARPEFRRRVNLRLGEEELDLVGLIDTGNALQEPLSGLPVMLIAPGLAKGLHLGKLRPVPFTALGAEGVIDAFYPDSVFLEGEKMDWFVAIYPGELDCDALLPGSCAYNQAQ